MVMTTTGTSTSVNSDDAWGQSMAVNTTRHIPLQPERIPNDWDADEDEEEEELESKELWELANTRAPMPEIHLSTTSLVGAQLPPPAALEAPLRILKRPSSTNSKSPSPSAVQMQKSLKEREAQYQAARERIFGDTDTKDKEASDIGNTGSGPNTSASGSGIIRGPLGPSSIDDDTRPGFRAKVKKAAISEMAAGSGDSQKVDLFKEK